MDSLWAKVYRLPADCGLSKIIRSNLNKSWTTVLIADTYNR